MAQINRLTPPRPPQTGRTYRAPWYDTTQWRKQRIAYLQQHPECELCIEEGRIGIPSVVVDHKINIASLPEEQREVMFWNQANWQGLCQRHHNSKSGMERR